MQKFKTKKRKEKILKSIQCDKCGIISKSDNYLEVGSHPYIETIHHHFGYGSIHDGSLFEIDLCDSCIEKIFNKGREYTNGSSNSKDCKEISGSSGSLVDDPEHSKNHRDYNIGDSNYSQMKIPPWDIWKEHHLNPWDADIIKRVLRTKGSDPRELDYQKIIHICQERLSQIEEGYNF